MNPFFIKAFTQVVGQLNRIRDGLFKRDGFCRKKGWIRFAGAPLVPSYNHKVLGQILKQHAQYGRSLWPGPPLR